MNNQFSAHAINSQDYLETTVIFGEIKKAVFSKNFQGGNVRSLFGSVVLDFTNADISGMVIIDVSQAFSETKIIVPHNWRVEVDVTHILSTTEDKRWNIGQSINSDKVLVITGISTFASVKIKSAV